MINIYLMACEYRDNNWKKIVGYTKESMLKIEGISQDIVNVLDALIYRRADYKVDR